MKNYLMMGSAAVLSLGLLLAACSDDETTAATTINPTTGGNGGTVNTGGGGAGAQGGGGNGVPQIPSLGAQIDRKGRPAVNTATTNTFDLVAANPDTARSDAEKAYNANDDPGTWATSYVSNIAANLAIYDSLADDGTGDGACGDQLFYGSLGNAGYGTLATVLANDWLTIYSGETACGYLGVETDILTGAATPTSCGGRTLSDDVMDATYGLVAPAAGFGDTIDAPAAAPSDTFPYLAASDAN